MGERSRPRAGEEETLTAWSALENAIQVVECALPSQMSQAIEQLRAERRRFGDLMLGRPSGDPG